MEPIQITVSGWKARQEAAKRKMANGKTKEDREAIRAARRRLYEQQAQGESPAKAEREEPELENEEGSTGEPDQQAALTSEDEETSGEDQGGQDAEMTREQMIQTLKDAGQSVGGNIKDETLAKRVEALHAEDETQE